MAYTLEMLGQGFLTVLTPSVLIYLIGGIIVGLILGAIPGLTATMAIALVIPLTFTMDATASLVMLLGAYNGGIFGGSISAILIGTPGTSSAVVTIADGYQLSRKGQGIKAIKMAIAASVSGALFSAIVLVFIARPIARFALSFGPGEYTMLMLFSLTIIGNAAADSFVKGLIGGVLGLLIATIGLDPMVAISRFTFGFHFLNSGIDIIVMLIGLLAISEIVKQTENIFDVQKKSNLIVTGDPNDEKLTFKEYRSSGKTIFRSSVIGCIIGALPGLGPTLAAYLGYDAAKKTSKHPEKFGTGILEGVAAPEAANNAVCGANMIPLLAFGIPGDTVAAMLIGAFMIQGITPGPLVFQDAPELIYGIYAGLILSNLILLIFAWSTAKGFTRIAGINLSLLFPIVIVFCMVGSYAARQDFGDLWIMLVFTVLGYLMMKFDFPPSTLLIGFILGPLFERKFRQAMIISKGSLSIFFGSPMTIFLWIITVLSIVFIIRNEVKERKKDNEKEMV